MTDGTLIARRDHEKYPCFRGLALFAALSLAYLMTLFTYQRSLSMYSLPMMYNEALMLISSNSSLIESGTTTATQSTVSSTTVVPETDQSTAYKAPISTQKNDTIHYYYIKERADRVGAAIQEMLFGHAYARYMGAVYAGACGNYSETATHLRFLRRFGLDKVLPYKCPSPHAGPNHEMVHRSSFILDRNVSRLFTQDWLHDMQRHVVYPAPYKNFSIAVHIRRGDITPCLKRADYRERYMSNQFYLDLINLYTANHTGVNVTIFSESNSYESFEDFNKYNLLLDTDPILVWDALFASDIVILSRSSFSLVPAWLRKGKVVSGPQFHLLMPHWDAAPAHIIRRNQAELKRLYASCSTPKTITDRIKL